MRKARWFPLQPGFTGRTSLYFLQASAVYGIVEFRLPIGSGGATCPLPVISPLPNPRR